MSISWNPRMDPGPVDFTSVWGELQQTVKEVITLTEVSRQTWNSKFSQVYSLCVATPSTRADYDPFASSSSVSLVDKLYAETKKLLETHLMEV